MLYFFVPSLGRPAVGNTDYGGVAMDKVTFLEFVDQANEIGAGLKIQRSDGTPEMLISPNLITRVDDSGITVADNLEPQDEADCKVVLFSNIVAVTIE